MSDAVYTPPPNDGSYRLLMEVREKLVAVEGAQNLLAAQCKEFRDDFDSFRNWTQRILYGVVVALVIGGLILLLLIATGRI